MMLAAEPILDRLRGLGLPRPLVGVDARVVDPLAPTGPTVEAARRRRFLVHGSKRRLDPPIDWRQDPFRSRSWQYELHTLTWLRPLVERHARTGDAEALAALHDVALDWVRQHLRPAGEVSEFAWYDMAVGLRAPYVAYVLRAGLAAGSLDDDAARLLVEAAERHGAELADPAKYVAGGNHGLYQDEGLYLLARQLPALLRAPDWERLALERLEATLRATVSFADGAHLEHSTAYQLAIANLLERLAPLVADAPWLAELLGRMRATAAWQVTPAGRLLQLGDTDDVSAPPWACDTAARLDGMRCLFEAGQAFVRDGDSYLAATAGHHGAVHKHVDDASFVLVEGGRTVLADAGRWGYYETEPDRLYARSGPAHNALTVDGRDPDWRWAEPYGSGLVAAGEGAGWHAIVLSNGLLAQHGVAHRRLLLYRPGRALVVVDAVRSPRAYDYERRFHLGAGLAARLDGERVEIRAAADGGGEETGGEAPRDGDGFAAVLADMGGEPPREGPPVTLARGEEPRRSGWWYPGDRERVPIWTVALRSRARDATFAAALSLGAEQVLVRRVAVEPSRFLVELGDESAVTVRLSGRRVYVAPA